MYKCWGTGTCIDKSLTCDGVDDCGDLSDEFMCLITALTPKCDDNSFHCDSRSRCVPNSARCNGTAECDDKSDERDCANCYVDEFECANKKCIPEMWMCDNSDDCGDGSDEVPKVCAEKKAKAMDKLAEVSCEHGFR